MTQKFTAEEVREKARAHSLRCDDRTAAMLEAYADTLSKPADSGRVGDARQELLDELELVILAHVGMQAGDEGAPAMTIRVCRAAIAALAAQGQGEVVAKVRHFDYRGIARNGFSQEAQMLDGAPVLPDGPPLYTRPTPPASPAGVPDDASELPGDAARWKATCKRMLAAPSAPEGDGGVE